MWRGSFDSEQITMASGVAAFQFSFQVQPLVEQLAASLGDPAAKTGPADFGSVEPVTAALGLAMNHCQVSGQRSGRIVEMRETPKLRVMTVTFGRAAENFLCEQRFTP